MRSWNLISAKLKLDTTTLSSTKGNNLKANLKWPKSQTVIHREKSEKLLEVRKLSDILLEHPILLCPSNSLFTVNCIWNFTLKENTMNPQTDKLVRRTTMVATAVASYLLLTADYGPEPNVLDPVCCFSSLLLLYCFSLPDLYATNFIFNS